MELIHNLELFQTIFNSAPNGIAVLQPLYNKEGKAEDFLILLFNNYLINWIGNSDYNGKRYSEIFSNVKETNILEKFIETLETGIPANFEHWYRHESEKHCFRFTAVNQGQLLVITMEDITEKSKQKQL